MMLLWAALWINDVYGQFHWCPDPPPPGRVKLCGGPGLAILLGSTFLVGVFVGVSVATVYFMRLAKAAPRDTSSDTIKVTEKKE